MTENKNIKRKLIIQSFMPLYIILVIKNFDAKMLILAKKLTEHLLKRDFKIISHVFNHPLFLSCIFEIIGILWILSAAFSIFEFTAMQRANFASQNESVKECEKISDGGVTFFMTYVLPMVMDEIGTLKNFSIFVFLMVMLCILMWKTNLYYQNPILTILGYEIVSFQFEHTELSQFQGDRTCIGITRHTKVKDGMYIRRQYISDNVFLIYEDK